MCMLVFGSCIQWVGVLGSESSEVDGIGYERR